MSLRILFASDVSTGTGKESTVGETTGDDGRGEDWDDFLTRRLVLPDFSLKEPDFCRRGDRVVAVARRSWDGEISGVGVGRVSSTNAAEFVE